MEQTEVKVDKRTKEYKEKGEIDYSKAENNPGFNLCMVCGQDKLTPNEDGTPKFRRFPEPCPDCVWRNK